jgi:hypothetical protein
MVNRPRQDRFGVCEVEQEMQSVHLQPGAEGLRGLPLPEEALGAQLWLRAEDIRSFRHGATAHRLVPTGGVPAAC